MNQLIAKAQELIKGGQLKAGVDALLDLIKIDPKDEEALQTIIAVARLIADKTESALLLGECTKIGVDSPILQYELGSTLLELGQYLDAIEYFKRVLDQYPQNFEALHDAGAAFALLGDKDQALKYLIQASAINDQSADLFYNLGRLNDDIFQYDLAIDFYQKAIKLDPLHTASWINLAIDFSIFKKYADSLRCFEQALSQNPNIDFLYGDCVYTKIRMCQWGQIEVIKNQLEGAINAGAKVISPFPLSALIDSPLLQQKTAKLYAESRYPANPALGPIPPHNNKKIRVAYFSPDFHEHPVSFLMAEVFELHNRDQFEIFAFSYGKDSTDPMRKRLKKSFDCFIDVSNKTSHEISVLSRELDIDIAVDLCGFTENTKTDIFALRAAPIQISYIGFLGTMGAQYIDYLIADEIIIPTSSRKFYSENIIYLPCYQANDSKRSAGSKVFNKEEFGIKSDQFVFCNLNNLFKVTEEIFNSWLNILRKTPNSVMMLYGENPYGVANLNQYALKKGINSERLKFVERIPREDYLARYKAVDLFLDTTPYNAGTTASDALWMNIPVITLQGESFASRVASSLLTHLNLSELIHQSLASYETQAIQLANEPFKLAAIRTKLAANKLAAPLFNSSLFVQNLEKAFLEAQINHKNTLPPKDIFIR